jgi:hypothetical protein
MSGELTSPFPFYHQAGKPSHWHLQDEVDLPNGLHLAGSKARVYQVLLLARDTAHCFPVGRTLAPAGWVPVWVFREPWAGGSAGDRRLRDLRQLGIQLEGGPFEAKDGAPASASWIWRLKPEGSSRPPQRTRPQQLTNPLQVSPSPGEGVLGWTGRGGRGVRAPLSNLTIHLRPGPRPALWSGELLDLSPGMHHPAAPTASLALRVAEGRLSQSEAQAAYRTHLLALYSAGDLARAFRAGTATVCCEAPFDALSILGRALASLGATIATPAATAVTVAEAAA